MDSNPQDELHEQDTSKYLKQLSDLGNSIERNDEYLKGNGLPDMKRSNLDRDVELSKAIAYWIELGPNATAVEEIKQLISLLSSRLHKRLQSVLRMGLVYGIVKLAQMISEGDEEVQNVLDNWADYQYVEKRERVLDNALNMKRRLPKKRFAEWAERNNLNPDNLNRFMDDDEENYSIELPDGPLTIRSWAKQKRMEGWITDSETARLQAIEDEVIDGSDKSVNNFRSQMSQLGISDKGTYNFCNSKV